MVGTPGRNGLRNVGKGRDCPQNGASGQKAARRSIASAHSRGTKRADKGENKGVDLMQLLEEKAKDGLAQTKCSSCAKAIPQLCAFMAAESENAEEILNTIGAEVVKHCSKNFNRKGGYTWYWYYKVTHCPNFEEGALPEIARAVHKITVPLVRSRGGFSDGDTAKGGIGFSYK